MKAVLFMSSGVMVWALHFMAIYGITALACARAAPGVVAPAIGVSSLAAIAALVVIFARGWRQRAVFESWLAASVAALALIAVVYETIPVLLVPICD
jgi:hypothetical protein